MGGEFSSGGRMFSLDEETGQLWAVRREAVPLSPRQAALLAYLMGQGGRQVSVKELEAAAWGDEPAPEGAVDHAVAGIRAALGDDAAAPLFIETLSQRGYRFLIEPEGGAQLSPAALADALADANAERLRPLLAQARRAGQEHGLGNAYDLALNTLDDAAGRGERPPALALDTVVQELQGAA